MWTKLISSNVFYLTDISCLLIISRILHTACPKGKIHILVNTMEWIQAHVEERVNQYIYLDTSPISNRPTSVQVRTNIFPNKNNELECITFT